MISKLERIPFFYLLQNKDLAHNGSNKKDLVATESPPCVDPEVGQGVQTPLKNHKNMGFLSNTGLDPLKNHKATEPAFNVRPSSARQQNTI